jgi:hypothetical protein
VRTSRGESRRAQSRANLDERLEGLLDVDSVLGAGLERRQILKHLVAAPLGGGALVDLPPRGAEIRLVAQQQEGELVRVLGRGGLQEVLLQEQTQARCVRRERSA